MKVLVFSVFMVLILPLSINAEILTRAEQKASAEYLNDICGDTFCGGDIDWTSPKVTCSKKYCSLIITANSYEADTPFFSLVDFEAADPKLKQGQGFKLLYANQFSDELYDDYGKTLGSVKNVEVVSWCRLELKASVKELNSYDKIEAVYDATLDCVDKIESAIYKIGKSI
ncbi:MAG: hypothetical protein AB8E15_00495 [Bdellovibrionales bacterium]